MGTHCFSGFLDTFSESVQTSGATMHLHFIYIYITLHSLDPKLVKWLQDVDHVIEIQRISKKKQ
jgi:hypothetical protein